MSTGDILVMLLLILIVGFSIRQVIKGRKEGGCPGCGSCSACKESCTLKQDITQETPGTEKTEGSEG